MSKIDEIKERHKEYADNPHIYDFVDGKYYVNDVSYLLSKLDTAQKALEEIYNVESLCERDPLLDALIGINQIANKALGQLKDD